MPLRPPPQLENPTSPLSPPTAPGWSRKRTSSPPASWPPAVPAGTSPGPFRTGTRKYPLQRRKSRPPPGRLSGEGQNPPPAPCRRTPPPPAPSPWNSSSWGQPSTRKSPSAFRSTCLMRTQRRAATGRCNSGPVSQTSSWAITRPELQPVCPKGPPSASLPWTR